MSPLNLQHCLKNIYGNSLLFLKLNTLMLAIIGISGMYLQLAGPANNVRPFDVCHLANSDPYLIASSERKCYQNEKCIILYSMIHLIYVSYVMRLLLRQLVQVQEGDLWYR